MTVPQKRVVIVGATGMVGGEALRYALDQPAVGAATAISRKPTGLVHPNLKEVLHQDFADCSALAGALTEQDAAVFCLGAYTGAVADAELRRSPWSTPSSSHECSAPAVPTRHMVS